MESLHNTMKTQKPKKKKKTPLSIYSLSVICLLIFFFLILTYNLIPKSTFAVRFPQCTAQISPGGEKFLYYAPHSGFSNQLSEFRNAILMAGILNRTLIVPPVMDHHAVALGSCPKFRVLDPNQIRISVWDHAFDLVRSSRYVSMTDIIDLSPLVSASVIRIIDFRVFVSSWCGVNMNVACSNGSDAHLKECRSLLSGLDGNVNKCVYALQEDCRTTVWTYQQNHKKEPLDSFQPDEKIQKKQKIAYIRRRRDVDTTLGAGSEVELSTVLAFGSLFTAPYKGTELYIDIPDAPRDPKIKSLIEKIKFLPFSNKIMSAGKKFASEMIKAPFLCAQLRLLDGQFKNHWNTTFLALQQKVEYLRRKAALPIHIFVMTDLPEDNWKNSYLGDLSVDVDSFKIHVLREDDNLVKQTAKRVHVAGHETSKMNYCAPQILPDILLYVEEAVCSCASLGFVGTAGSTIAESIELMRKYGVCLSENQISL